MISDTFIKVGFTYKTISGNLVKIDHFNEHGNYYVSEKGEIYRPNGEFAGLINHSNHLNEAPFNYETKRLSLPQ